MGQMYCGICHKFGIYWVGLGGLNEHTYCPHCKGINCQQIENTNEEEDNAEEEK
jgi:hypothetical protein